MFYEKGTNKNGGVVIVVGKHLKATKLETNMAKTLIIDIFGLNEPLCVIGVYWPDSQKRDIEEISQFITKNTIIAGDFNASVKQWNSPNTDKRGEILEKWCTENNLEYIEGTMNSSKRSKCNIDFSFTNFPGITGETLEFGTSDHWPLMYKSEPSAVPFNKLTVNNKQLDSSSEIVNELSKYYENLFTQPCVSPADQHTTQIEQEFDEMQIQLDTYGNVPVLGLTNRETTSNGNSARTAKDSSFPGRVRCATPSYAQCHVCNQPRHRPHPNEMSGSDLDGDQYWVYWSNLLKIRQMDEPFSYDTAKKAVVPNVTRAIIVDHINDSFDAASPGIICSVHLAIADSHPAHTRSNECKYLAELFARAVDAPKSESPHASSPITKSLEQGKLKINSQDKEFEQWLALHDVEISNDNNIQSKPTVDKPRRTTELTQDSDLSALTVDPLKRKIKIICKFSNFRNSRTTTKDVVAPTSGAAFLGLQTSEQLEGRTNTNAKKQTKLEASNTPRKLIMSAASSDIPLAPSMNSSLFNKTIYRNLVLKGMKTLTNRIKWTPSNNGYFIVDLDAKDSIENNTIDKLLPLLLDFDSKHALFPAYVNSIFENPNGIDLFIRTSARLTIEYDLLKPTVRIISFKRMVLYKFLQLEQQKSNLSQFDTLKNIELTFYEVTYISTEKVDGEVPVCETISNCKEK
ncbi:hypothetical protein I4U23_011496 [Adineta vaga]|nr:hypothetical protein I4U23_011496 [Adineta vaga]